MGYSSKWYWKIFHGILSEPIHLIKSDNGGIRTQPNAQELSMMIWMLKYLKSSWSGKSKRLWKLGFNERWITLMMTCVKIVSYSVLVIGEPQDLFWPTRGIRQGDPLSPFLFLLCTEGLHNLILKAENEGSTHGFALSKRSPKLTHPLFADDSLVFCRSKRQECQKVLDILATYESMSG